MAGLLQAQAIKLSNNQLVSGVIEQIIEKDDLFAVLPFVQVNGKAYVYNRELALATAAFLAPGTGTITADASTFSEITTNLRVLAGDVDVDKFMQDTMGDTNDQMAIQIAMKAKGVAKKFKETLAKGRIVTAGLVTGDANAFDGLDKLLDDANSATSGQIIGATTGGVTTNGGALTLALMDELLDAVPNGADAIVMRRGTIRAYRQLVRAANGNDAPLIMMENFGRPMLTHNGVPIIMNEYIDGGVTTGTVTAATCSVFAVRLNEADGLHGLYGGSNAGIVVENIGTVQNQDATRIRLKWYAGLALKSTRSIAGIRGITNI